MKYKTELRSTKAIIITGFLNGLFYSLAMAGFDYYDGSSFHVNMFIFNFIFFGFFMGFALSTKVTKQ